MKIENKKHLETLYDIVRDTWELFQQDFEGDPDLEFSSDYEDLINFHENVMRILRNENECALERLRDKNKSGGLK